MSKRLSYIFISIILLFSASNITFALNSPQDAISESKIKFQQLNDDILETNSEIAEINSEMYKLNKTISKNNSDISKSEKEIKSQEIKIGQLTEDINSSQNILDERLRVMYKNGYNLSYLSLVLTSDNLSDFFMKLKVLKRVISFDKNLITSLKLKKEVLNETLEDMNKKNRQLQQLKSSNLTTLHQLDTKKNDLNNLVIKFNEEKKNAAIIIEENERKLISHSINIIDSSTSSIIDMKNALNTLKSLSPQISTASVKEKADNYIEEGEKKLAVLIANSKNPIDDSITAFNGISKATFTMSASAYTGHGITAMGLKPVRDASGLSTIAVDPDILPLGTKVYIEDYGYAICADTGGAIKGNKIDLYMNSEDECYQWGRRSVTLYIIAYPGEW